MITDDTGDTMFVNEVQPKPTSRGMTMCAPPITMAMPAPGHTAATPHAHTKASSRLAVTIGVGLIFMAP